MEIKICVAYHKPSDLLPGDIYLPIHVGKSLHPELNLGIQGDNEGDNISDENGYYCELTALYWLWKNVKADVKGLFHYRRILATETNFKLYLRKQRDRIFKRDYLPSLTMDKNKFLDTAKITSEKIPQMMIVFDILTTRKCKFTLDVNRYFSNIGREYITILRKALFNKYPEYVPKFEESLKSYETHFANITVMKNSIFNDYCQFIFTTLEEVKRILIDDNYLIDLKSELIFSRILGYLAEILTNVYVEFNKTKYSVKELPVAFLY